MLRPTIVVPPRQISQRLLSGGFVNAADSDASVDDHVIAFGGFWHAGHLANAANAGKLDFGRGEQRVAVEPADDLAWNA
jgi:hypothetical protein